MKTLRRNNRVEEVSSTFGIMAGRKAETYDENGNGFNLLVLVVSIIALLNVYRASA